MTVEKEKLLKETYDKFMQIGLNDFSMKGMEEFIDREIMGYGTTVGEKILSFDDYRELIIRQREQGKDIKKTFNTTHVHHRIAQDGNSALFVDEIIFSIHIEDNPIEMFLRVSTLLEYSEEKWVVVHWHGSKPEYEDEETDTWHIDEWKQKTEELERLVDEKTSELIVKNRELEIETSLERVRSKAMAMNSSKDLTLTADTFFTELEKLNVKSHRCGIGIVDRKTRIVDVHGTTATEEKVQKIVTGNLKLTGHPVLEKIFEGFEKQEEYHPVLKGKEILEYYEVMNPQVKFPDFSDDEIQYGYYFYFREGGVFAWTDKEYTDNELEIFRRYTSVLSLTYRRYLDLKEAEAQAKEAKIEAGLERVRASAMAMHKSEQLSETAKVLFEEFAILGKIPDRMSIGVIDEVSKNVEMWVTDQGGNDINHEFFFSIEEPTSIAKIYVAWKEEKDFALINLTGQNLKAWLDFVKDVVKLSIDETKIKGRRVQQAAFFSHGFLLLTTHQPISDEIMNLLVRFARVFNQTYTRFLDLLNAEAQAREAQIEGALERVRSKTMAMHNSNDVGETVATLFHEVLKLGLDKSIRCGIGILEGNEGMETWSATSYPNGEVDQKMGMVDMTVHPLLIGVKNSWKNDETGFTYELSGNDVTSYYNALNNEPEYPFHVELETLPEKVFHNSFTFSEGILFSFTSNPISVEVAKVLNRFASVFGQTYRRYLDLQKAEALAREAKIEASLERVRAKAMAMFSSEDLVLTIDLFFKELKNLNFNPIRSGVGIWDGKTRFVNVTVTSATLKGEDQKITGKLYLGGHPILDNVFEALKKQVEYFPTLQGDEINEYYQAMDPHVEFPNFSEDDVQYGYYFHFKEGGVFAWTEKELLEEQIEMFRKFKSVLSLTYRRYMDLKEAEAQNLIIQAENERKSEELEEARQLQLAMLPKELPILPNLDIAVYMQTATEVGGDYYDFHVEDDGTLTAVIGDATGHGLKAGTIVTITKSLFHSLVSGKDILSSFAEISRVIKGMNFRQLSMCLQMLKIKGNQLLISSAAMPPALIYRKKNQEIEEISFEGMPLGAMTNFPYSIKESRIEKGDTILMLSDGLPELTNDKKEMYGYDRTKDEFHSVGEKEPEEIVNHLKNSSSQWVNNNDPDDDVTFVVIKVK